LDVRKLNGINIDSNYGVMGGQSHRSAASRGYAKNTPPRLEHPELNFTVLIHASE
jgi:hypothetical protein